MLLIAAWIENATVPNGDGDEQLRLMMKILARHSPGVGGFVFVSQSEIFDSGETATAIPILFARDGIRLV